MRASFDVFFGSTKSLGGLEVLVGRGLIVEGVGSGVDSFGVAFVGFERVLAIVVYMFLQ